MLSGFHFVVGFCFWSLQMFFPGVRSEQHWRSQNSGPMVKKGKPYECSNYDPKTRENRAWMQLQTQQADQV